MKYLFFTLVMLLCIYLALHSEKDKISFLSKEHSYSIKGVAIILIILNHMGGIYGIRYLTPLGGIGVSMFLICSGYGLTTSYNKNGLKNYWIKKINYVLIPYMTIEILVTLFRNENTFRNVILDLFILNTKHPYGWYLKLLLLWYIVFFIIGKLGLLSKSKVYLFYVLSILMIVYPDSLWAEQALSFPIGVTLTYYKDDILKIIDEKRYLYKILLFTGIIFLGIKQIDILNEIPYFIFNIIQMLIKLPIACSICIYIYIFSEKIKNNLFREVGVISYSLYLIHGYTINCLIDLNYINIVFFLMITLSISYIFEKIVCTRIRNKIYKIKLSSII